MLHMSTLGSPGLRGHPTRAPHWPDRVIVFPNWPPSPTDSPKRAAPAHIRTFTGRHVNTHFTSTKTTIQFLHMEHSNTQLLHIFHIYFSRFTSIFHINTIYLLMHIRPLPSRTQHRLTRSCHLWRAPPTPAAVTTGNPRDTS